MATVLADVACMQLSNEPWLGYLQAADCVSTMGFYVRRALDANGMQEVEISDMVMCVSSGMTTEQLLHEATHACKSCARQASQLHYNVLDQHERTAT